MIYIRPTSGAKLVMKKWIEELEVQPWSKAKKANDQPAFNWALNKTAGQVCFFFCFLIMVACLFDDPLNISISIFINSWLSLCI